MASHLGTFFKRAERVLIELAEDESATVKQRLEATAQLIRIKGVKPRAKARSTKAHKPDVSLSSVLGSTKA